MSDITPVILTFDEETNVGRMLAALKWARDIVVVDSGSTDGTARILRSDQRVRIFERPFDTHAQQWNFALRKTGIRTSWVMALDADYVVSDALTAELRTLDVRAEMIGYRVSFAYVLLGRTLRRSLYPPSIILFRHQFAEYVQDGHTQRLKLHGPVGDLQGVIFHDDRKPSSRWRDAQRKYVTLEARKLRITSFKALSWPDRARRFYLGPLLVLPYCLLLKGLMLDGLAGFYYTFQRLYSETLLALELAKLDRGDTGSRK